VNHDISPRVAQYYDLNPGAPPDVPFYARLVPSPTASVLELGCGTGRVLLPLMGDCGFIHGIDNSDAMLDVCRDRLRRGAIPASRAQVALADVSDFDLGRTFDLIVAPYRVVQNLEADSSIDGLFRCLHAHLAHGGMCVLNAFKPSRGPDELRRNWTMSAEKFRWEVPVEDGRVTCHERRPRLNPDPLILYSELVWRRYEHGALVDETVLSVPTRYYAPDQFTRLIADHGFIVVQGWGGYAGEAYGVGPELLVQFRAA
jgi:SAM-dependent methyltransferase